MRLHSTLAAAAWTASVTLSGAVAAPAVDPSGIQHAAAPSVHIDKAQYYYPYYYGGYRYCWYPRGWRGPGWYWCGYAWRYGYGWGGPYGWRGWGWGPYGWRGWGWRYR